MKSKSRTNSQTCPGASPGVPTNAKFCSQLEKSAALDVRALISHSRAHFARFASAPSMPEIWETERLPALEELRPEKELLEEERVSIRYGREMVRAVGKRSHAKSLGEGCGQHEHEAAWATLRGLEDGALEAVAVGFAEHECSALGTELRAGSRNFARLFLSAEGLSLLQAVAKELHGLSLEHCWAWCACRRRQLSRAEPS